MLPREMCRRNFIATHSIPTPAAITAMNAIGIFFRASPTDRGLNTIISNTRCGCINSPLIDLQDHDQGMTNTTTPPGLRAP